MKLCRKCKAEYKSEYIFCPKCGTPYDKNMKRARIPGEGNIIKKIWNILLYILGGLLILANIANVSKNPKEGIMAILFGLSLFQIFYDIIEDKFNNIEEKYLKLARIVSPIFILIVWMLSSAF